jgi:hypothetical protein
MALLGHGFIGPETRLVITPPLDSGEYMLAKLSRNIYYLTSPREKVNDSEL